MHQEKGKDDISDSVETSIQKNVRTIAGKLELSNLTASIKNDEYENRHISLFKKYRTIHSSQLTALQTRLVFKILVEFRSRLKILFYAEPLHVLPPPTLFSWYLRDFRARMSAPNLLFLTKFDESPRNVQEKAKMNAELKTMIEIADFLVDDYVFGSNLGDLENIINDMKQLLIIQNTSIKKYLGQKRQYKLLKKRLHMADDESAIEMAEYGSTETISVVEDEFAFEEKLLSSTTYGHVCKRYTKHFKQTQIEQLRLMSHQNENSLLQTITDYNLKYQREKAVFQSIEQANEHITLKLDDEVSMINRKYDYECEQLDLECNRKKNEILAVADKHYTMQKKMQEMIAEIGDEVLEEVVHPSVWTVLHKLVEERELEKLAQQAKKAKGKTDKKLKK